MAKRKAKPRTKTVTFETTMDAHCWRPSWCAFWRPTIPDPGWFFPELGGLKPRRGARVKVTMTVELLSKGRAFTNPWAEQLKRKPAKSKDADRYLYEIRRPGP